MNIIEWAIAVRVATYVRCFVAKSMYRSCVLLNRLVFEFNQWNFLSQIWLKQANTTITHTWTYTHTHTDTVGKMWKLLNSTLTFWDEGYKVFEYGFGCRGYWDTEIECYCCCWCCHRHHCRQCQWLTGWWWRFWCSGKSAGSLLFAAIVQHALMLHNL